MNTAFPFTTLIPPSPRRSAAFLIPLLILCAAFSDTANAVSPPPDGGYSGGNTAEGQDALFNLTAGTYNTAVGLFSLRSNTIGSFNTATGAGTLLFNTGNDNTATGGGALLSNTSGTSNTASGESALFFNTTGANNTANGASALQSNTTGANNTATGYQALLNNTTPNGNTATGFRTLESNTTGELNTATGTDALFRNTTGRINTATGFQALNRNTTGLQNTATGTSALIFNTSGGANTADGSIALSNNTTGNNNTALGLEAGSNVTTADNVTCVGANVPGANVSNTTWIGNVYGVTTQNAMTAPVIVSADGQLGTVASSERFKTEIASMDKTSEAVLLLRPVTFHYRMDTKGAPQFGLVAEEVAKVNPALVLPDKEGKPYSVRYDAVNAMLLNEFLKEHRRVEQLEKQVETLTAGLQRVSAQLAAASPCGGVLEASKLTPQVAVKDR